MADPERTRTVGRGKGAIKVNLRFPDLALRSVNNGLNTKKGPSLTPDGSPYIPHRDRLLTLRRRG